MSTWSGFSKCSKQCGGGSQGQTRSILTKPLNGGLDCGVTVEERPCETQSCDRDCILGQWTDWAPCSMACGGGLQKRVRKVVEPIMAQGRCPTPDSADRLQMQTCNSQECQRDEICIAGQDLIIVIDASGSVGEDGLNMLKELAVNL